jgi:hypothetical protein
MKFYKQILIILIVFLQTGNVLSENNIFNVNNIELEKIGQKTNDELANLAIKKGFQQLIARILLEEDKNKLSGLEFSEIKELVTYYQITNRISDSNTVEKINYNISFDKDKFHNLFYKRAISYSKITNKELFILPILKKNNQIFIFNQNFFYDNWNKIYDNELIEFILPLENIEIIQNINLNQNNLLNLELKNLFEEYPDKNFALVLIDEGNLKNENVYFKIKISNKNIIKKIVIKKFNLSRDKFYEKVISEVKKEIINIIKSQNLIDIRTPSFLNASFDINKKNNLVQLNSRLKKNNLVENIYVQEFNNQFVVIKIKYLGKLEKIINQLEEEKIILKLINDQWNIKIL